MEHRMQNKEDRKEWIPASLDFAPPTTTFEGRRDRCAGMTKTRRLFSDDVGKGGE
jgi:hypothetical protein